MELNLFNDVLTRNGAGEITYDTFVEDILSSIETKINEGAITSFQDALNNFIGSRESSALASLWASAVAESYSMKPLENSKVHNWEDDELITKELLQAIEDKLRISLTKTDLLNYLLVTYLAPEEKNPFEPFVPSFAEEKEVGQLKTYLISAVSSTYWDRDLKVEPFYFITNTSSGGFWEPRGLMEIYMLPTSNKSQLDDLEFEMDYRNSDSELLNLGDLSSFNPDHQDLIALCYLKTPEDPKISQCLTLSLSYSEETGLYIGSEANVSSTYSYTCSFDPKTWKFTVSISRGSTSHYFGDILGKEIVGVSVQSKNQFYIPAGVTDGRPAASYYLNDAPYKRNIVVQAESYESKITNEYSYTLTEN